MEKAAEDIDRPMIAPIPKVERTRLSPIFETGEPNITLHHLIFFGFYGKEAKHLNGYNYRPELSFRKFCKDWELSHRVMVKTVNRLEAIGGKLLLERDFKDPTRLIPQPRTPAEATAMGADRRRGILLPFGILWSEFALLVNTLLQIVSQARDAGEAIDFVRDLRARAEAQLSGKPQPLEMYRDPEEV